MKRTALTATLIAVTVLLTGCASTGTADVFGGGSQAEPTATAEPSAPAFAVGDLVEKDTDLPKGQTAYPLPDGTHMVVARTEPLPEVVTADLTARASVVAQANYRVNQDTSNDVIKNRGVFDGELIRSTGKRPLVVWEQLGFPTAEHETPVVMWASPNLPRADMLQTTREGMEAAVTAYLAGHDEPETFAVIWAK